MNDTTDISVHALVGAYAIDALDDAELASFEAHLADCTDCRAEVASLRETAAVLGGAAQMTPSASVRDAVLAGIGAAEPVAAPAEPVAAARAPAARPDAPATGPAHRDADVVVLPRRRARIVAAGVAAAVIAAIGVGSVVVDSFQDDATVPTAAPTTLAERVQAADDAETVSLDLGDGARATVVRSTSLNRAVLTTENMPRPPEGKVFEVWYDDAEDGYLPAGLMSTASDQTVVLTGDAANASGVGITVEPAQGSRVPTTEPIALFGFDPGKA